MAAVECRFGVDQCRSRSTDAFETDGQAYQTLPGIVVRQIVGFRTVFGQWRPAGREQRGVETAGPGKSACRGAFQRSRDAGQKRPGAFNEYE
ncbi:hypothetical protein PT2222_70027 [Paraburkholderia tropica]